VARAIDEQVALDPLAAPRAHCFDVAIRAAVDGNHLVAQMRHTKRLDRMARKPRCQLRCIEVIGVIQRSCVRSHRSLPRRQLGCADGRLRTHRKGIRRIGR